MDNPMAAAACGRVAVITHQLLEGPLQEVSGYKLKRWETHPIHRTQGDIELIRSWPRFFRVCGAWSVYLRQIFHLMPCDFTGEMKSLFLIAGTIPGYRLLFQEK